ncbi:hypothetical protein GCM10027596_36550 [Nocardioides korecus]
MIRPYDLLSAALVPARSPSDVLRSVECVASQAGLDAWRSGAEQLSVRIREASSRTGRHGVIQARPTEQGTALSLAPASPEVTEVWTEDHLRRICDVVNCAASSS